MGGKKTPAGGGGGEECPKRVSPNKRERGKGKKNGGNAYFSNQTKQKKMG